MNTIDPLNDINNHDLNISSFSLLFTAYLVGLLDKR